MGKVLKKDFVKKKVKLGKKLAKKNETKIKLRTKKIHLPHQNSILQDESNTDDMETATKLLRQLQHYSEHHRVQALIGIKVFLTASNRQSDRFITMVYPEMFELLFKDDHETRDSLVETISYTTHHLKAESFESVMSVLVTYLCSGLTHINKSIRRDSMLILLAFAEKSADLIKPYAQKLLSHLMLILHDKTLPLLLNPENVNGKKVKMSMFQLVLRNIGSVMLSMESNRVTLDQHQFDTSFQWSKIEAGNSNSGSVVFIRGRRRSHDYAVKMTDCKVSHELDEALFSRLTDIWRDIVSVDGSMGGFIILDALRQIVGVLSILIQLNGTEVNRYHHDCVNTLLSSFPFFSKEAVVASHGSVSHIAGNLKAESLNIEICEFIFHSLRKVSSGQNFKADDQEGVFSIIQNYLVTVMRPTTINHEIDNANGEADFGTSFPCIDKNNNNTMQAKAEIFCKILKCAMLFVRENVDVAHVHAFVSHVVMILDSKTSSKAMTIHASKAVIDISSHLFCDPSSRPSSLMLSTCLSGLRLALLALTKSKHSDNALIISLFAAVRSCLVCHTMWLEKEGGKSKSETLVTPFKSLSQVVFKIISEEDEQGWFHGLDTTQRCEAIELVRYLETETVKSSFRKALKALVLWSIKQPSYRSQLSCLAHILFHMRHLINYDSLAVFQYSLDMIDSLIFQPQHLTETDIEQFNLYILPVVDELAFHVRLSLIDSMEASLILQSIIHSLRQRLKSMERSPDSLTSYAVYSIVFSLCSQLYGLSDGFETVLWDLIMDCSYVFLSVSFDCKFGADSDKVLFALMRFVVAKTDGRHIFSSLLNHLTSQICAIFSTKTIQTVFERIRIILCQKISIEKSHIEVAKLQDDICKWGKELNALLLTLNVSDHDRIFVNSLVIDLINCF